MPPSLTTHLTTAHLWPSFLDDDSSSSLNWRFPPPACSGRRGQAVEEEEEGMTRLLRPSPCLRCSSSSLQLVCG